MSVDSGEPAGWRERAGRPARFVVNLEETK